MAKRHINMPAPVPQPNPAQDEDKGLRDFLTNCSLVHLIPAFRKTNLTLRELMEMDSYLIYHIIRTHATIREIHKLQQSIKASKETKYDLKSIVTNLDEPLQRGHLINTVTMYFLQKDIPLTQAIRDDLARQIVNVYPGEKLEYYSDDGLRYGGADQLYVRYHQLMKLKQYSGNNSTLPPVPAIAETPLPSPTLHTPSPPTTITNELRVSAIQSLSQQESKPVQRKRVIFPRDSQTVAKSPNEPSSGPSRIKLRRQTYNPASATRGRNSPPPAWNLHPSRPPVVIPEPEPMPPPPETVSTTTSPNVTSSTNERTEPQEESTDESFHCSDRIKELLKNNLNSCRELNQNVLSKSLEKELKIANKFRSPYDCRKFVETYSPIITKVTGLEIPGESTPLARRLVACLYALPTLLRQEWDPRWPTMKLSSFVSIYPDIQQFAAALPKKRDDPFVSIIGQLLSPNSYVVYYKMRVYRFMELWQAMDMCAKLYMTGTAKISKDSASAWQFVLVYFYALKAKTLYYSVRSITEMEVQQQS